MRRPSLESDGGGVEPGSPTVHAPAAIARQRTSRSDGDGDGPYPSSEASTDSEARRRQRGAEPQHIFIDPEEMKRKVRENLIRPTYDVSMYYHPEGYWRDIATSPAFEKVTLGVIAFNAVWISVDTNYNTADTFTEAHPVFQIMEHCFCCFFSFEWFSRFMSFRKKHDGLRDAWFVFDTILATSMVLEVWVLTAVLLWSGVDGSKLLGNASLLRLARLARLSRMARIVRLLRAMPELLILLKGIAAATRSVLITLSLLTIIMYVFAIAFTQMASNMSIGPVYFGTVSDSMYTLLVYGVLLDGTGVTATDISNDSYMLLGLFFLFVLVGNLTLMNMLIGVLTEVVSAVAGIEKESMTVSFVKTKMQEVLDEIDRDSDGTISKEEFCQILGNKEATKALWEVGVDVIGLVDFADFIFAGEEGTVSDERLDFTKFMEVVLQFRGSNKATVKDIVNLRKFVTRGLIEQRDSFHGLRDEVLSRAKGLRGAGSRARSCPAAPSTKRADGRGGGAGEQGKPSDAIKKRRRREEERLALRAKGMEVVELRPRGPTRRPPPPPHPPPPAPWADPERGSRLHRLGEPLLLLDECRPSLRPLGPREAAAAGAAAAAAAAPSPSPARGALAPPRAQQRLGVGPHLLESAPPGPPSTALSPLGPMLPAAQPSAPDWRPSMVRPPSPARRTRARPPVVRRGDVDAAADAPPPPPPLRPLPSQGPDALPAPPHQRPANRVWVVCPGEGRAGVAPASVPLPRGLLAAAPPKAARQAAVDEGYWSCGGTGGTSSAGDAF